MRRTKREVKLIADCDRLAVDLGSSRSAMHAAQADSEQKARQISLLEAVVRNLEARNLVLQSDRDRLTAALESCTRRLASPEAELDRTRAGWRASRDQAPIEQTRQTH